ncbi:Calmodulin [Durusdinium trenchii]|uniref:ubiquitinyl hydrolase 1 n=1 Tax=Durusdinium trenchii TaxID=1381693 RepID=A0ABP0HEX8_9DINO
MAVDEDAQLQEALLQSEAMECDEAPRVAAGEPPRDEANAEVDGPNLLLLDLFAAEEGSQLASLCQLLLRIEAPRFRVRRGQNWMSMTRHVCVELPRLKLTLLPKEGSLEVKDAGGWFVKSEEETSNALAKLREGLEQALLIENAQGDLRLLLPNHDVTRPLAKGEPFSTRLIFNRSSFGWQETMDFPYYLYPVHGTQTFLQATSLAASLYLSLLCLLSRDYAKAFAELDNCWTDVPLLAEEKWVFNQFANSLEDQHPDAHAVRCKLALSVAFVEDVSMPMELHLELDQYLAKRHHVSRGLWLNEEEELQLLRLCKSSTRRVKARLEYLAGKARGQVHVTLRADPALHGGQPWSRLNLLPREELRRATHVRRLQFRHPQLPEGSVNQEWPQQVDGEALVKMIWTDELLQDDESGVNRSLGFVFLYMVLLGQLELKLNDVNVTESLGGLLTRLFHLKLARWGKELQEEGESDVQLSHQMATLALLARGGSIAAGWPPVPSDAANRSALAKGQNLYDAIGRESPLKMWLDQVDQIFHQILNEAPRSEAFVVPETWAPKMELQVMLEELELRRRGRDDRCARLELPSELRQHAGQEILAHLDLNAFVSWTHEAFQSAEPFDLSSHPCTRTSVAQNLLKRLAEDCQRYAEICAQRRTPVVCGFDPAQPETCAQRLEELEQALRASAREDGQRTLEAIETMLADANGLPESEEVFDFKLQRDLCRLEQHVTFDYAMSCIVSSKAQEDLLRLNPYLTYKASAVLCHALAVTLLSGRQLQARRAAELALRLARRLRAGSEEVTTLQQELSFLGELLTERRCYIRQEQGASQTEPSSLRRRATSGARAAGQEADQFVLDPRFLLFEFMQHIVLRPRQVEMVDWFMQSYKEGESRVQQMIMGAGKTTVVGPLLSTMLSQPDVLVTQVMPSPLLDQSRQILRASFSKLMPKRIVTFQFDRQVDDCPETIMKIYTKLEACRRACGIVVSSPESIKSMLLKFIEQLHALASYDFSTLAPGASVRSDRELARQRDTLERRSGMADAVVRLIQLWKMPGRVIMDEVDVLLHPLKSELNFPIGFRDPIDLSGHRWNLPIHLVEGAEVEGNETGILFAAHEHPLESSLQGSIAQENREGDGSCWEPQMDALSGLLSQRGEELFRWSR